MKIKEIFNNLPHKKVYIGIGVFVFLMLIAIVVNKTHAFYNNGSDTIPIVNATIGDFRPVISTMYVGSSTTQPQYTNSTTPSVYLAWNNDDITEYCVAEGVTCTNYIKLKETDTTNKYVNGTVTFNGEGTKIIYVLILNF